MLLSPFFREPARHLYKLARDANYRSWCALDATLGGAPRFQERRATANGWNLLMPDAASFLSAYREIFVNGIYDFESASKTPRVLDIGANVGLAVLYVKTKHPYARITAYEPDPKIFRYLEHNVHGNGFTDVELVNKAVWKESGELIFHAEGADGGRIISEAGTGAITIEAVDVAQVLGDEQIDFVKIDIEGAETAVIAAAGDRLTRVRNIFVEYHSDVGAKQELAEMLGTLTDAGFRLDIQNPSWNPRPLIRKRPAAGFDLQLNVFGTRA